MSKVIDYIKMKFSKEKPDIAKIIICGIPILLIVWAGSFLALAYFSRDLNITKYGAFAIFVSSIPLYIFLAYKNAKKLNVVVDDVEDKIRNGSASEFGKKKTVTRYHLFVASCVIILLPTYAYIAQVHYGLSFKSIKNHFLVAIVIIAALEFVFLRLKRNKIEKSTD